MRGTGTPVTVVAHGLGASVAETRAVVSRVGGTLVLPAAVGHGRPGAAVGYAGLAADLRATADGHEATQAVGVSLGAGTVLRLLSETPGRFAKAVLVLPAALDHPVRRTAGLAQALTARDRTAVEATVRADLPADVDGRSVEAYVRARTAFLLASDLLPLLSSLADDVPVLDSSALRGVTADVLVVAQEDDHVHPVEVAREVVRALPHARLEVLGPAAVFREGLRLRSLVAGHFVGPTG